MGYPIINEKERKMPTLVAAEINKLKKSILTMGAVVE